MPLYTFTVGNKDLNSNGDVKYAVYFDWCKDSIEDLLKTVGFDFDILKNKYKVLNKVKKVVGEYNCAVSKGDMINIETKVSHIGNSSIVYENLLCRGETEIGKVKIIVVMTDLDAKPCTVPEDLRNELAFFA